MLIHHGKPERFPTELLKTMWAAQGSQPQINGIKIPGGWTQAEIFYKSFSGDSNELLEYKNHWLRISRVGEDA